MAPSLAKMRTLTQPSAVTPLGMADYEEEEDWESYEETLFGLSASQLATILNVIMWLIGAGLLMWIGLAVFGPKPKGKTKELYESKVEHFKADSVEDGAGEGAGVFSNVAKSFKRVLNLEPEKKAEAAQRFKADISCVPFGCPDARMAAGFAIDQETGAAFLYGGYDEEREGGFLQDLHYYDTGKFQWKKISGNKGLMDGAVTPGKRVHVRMACANKMLCLFGGSTEVRVTLFLLLLLLLRALRHLTPLLSFRRTRTTRTTSSSWTLERAPSPGSRCLALRTRTPPPLNPKPGTGTPCAPWARISSYLAASEPAKCT